MFKYVLECRGSAASERSNCSSAVRLIHVVVGNPEIGAGIGLTRIDPQRILVPAGCLFEAFGVEIEIRKLHARGGVGGAPFGGGTQL
jgi:hypothetical protein